MVGTKGIVRGGTGRDGDEGAVFVEVHLSVAACYGASLGEIAEVVEAGGGEGESSPCA